jgi:hypothetical protein
MASTPPEATASEVAHAFFLQGQYLMNLRRGDDLRRAIDYFERLVDEDPGYAAAHAYLAQTFLLLSGGGVTTVQAAADTAALHATRALAADDHVAAHTSMAKSTPLATSTMPQANHSGRRWR